MRRNKSGSMGKVISKSREKTFKWNFEANTHDGCTKPDRQQQQWGQTWILEIQLKQQAWKSY
jgi:hypothetical protein